VRACACVVRGPRYNCRRKTHGGGPPLPLPRPDQDPPRRGGDPPPQARPGASRRRAFCCVTLTLIHTDPKRLHAYISHVTHHDS